jgi:hypothetical protein
MQSDRKIKLEGTASDQNAIAEHTTGQPRI